MEILYKNEFGCVRFVGSGYGEWHIMDVTGLGLPLRTFETVTYAGEAGQVTLSERFEARTVTLSAEVRGKSREERAVIYTEALKVFAHPGDLTVRGVRERRIRARVADIAEGERHGNFKTYAVQFVCDSPFFTDVSEQRAAMYLREDLLGRDTGGKFTIGEGQVLTRRITGGTLLNDGDFECAGVMKIQTFGEGEAELEIENAATGGAVKLTVTAKKTYTIDFDARTITDETGADALEILSSDSYLSDFYLVPGANEIRFTVESESVSEAEFTYNKRYLSA